MFEQISGFRNLNDISQITVPGMAYKGNCPNALPFPLISLNLVSSLIFPQCLEPAKKRRLFSEICMLCCSGGCPLDALPPARFP
jgi:hypothetical protein